MNFFGKKEECRSLSNFSELEVMIDKRLYESGEHAYHGERFVRLAELCVDNNRKMLLSEYGKQFLKPSAFKCGANVKAKGGKNGFRLEDAEMEIWTTSIGIEVQRKICLWKRDNYMTVRNDLEKTKGKILVHPAMRCSEEKLLTRLWEGRGVVIEGKIVILGKNMLGNLWMELRDEPINLRIRLLESRELLRSSLVEKVRMLRLDLDNIEKECLEIAELTDNELMLKYEGTV